MNKNRDWLNGRVIATVLIIKVIILVFGFQSYLVLSEQPFKGAYEFFGIWRHWDAVSYLKISGMGYAAEGENRFLLVFFPLYPFLTAAFNLIVRDNIISAFLVSGLATVVLGLVFRELVRSDHPEETAQLAVWFMFIFPTGFFLHIPYTESLFLALTVGSFLAARKRSWLIAGILGGAACLTRINGVFIFPALLFEVWNEYRDTRQFNRRWFALLLIPAGFGSYLGLNYWVAGDPLKFLEYQREHWYKYFRLPWYGVKELIGGLFYKSASEMVMHSIQELLFVLIGLAATIAGWRHLRNSYRVWMIANWLIFISTSFVLSVPRYTLILFPLFILMAAAAVRRWWVNVAFTVWSLIFLAFFVTLFVQGRWAF